MDPETAAVSRFSAGAWETPLEGSGRGCLDFWLAVSLNGSAAVTWGERVPELGGGDFTQRTWARRYLPGRGWAEAEALQTVASEFDAPFVSGSNVGPPPLHTGVVVSDTRDLQAFWNRAYRTGRGFSPTDIYSTRLSAGAQWSPEEPVAVNATITLVRVSRFATLVFGIPTASSSSRIYDARRGWLEPGVLPASFLRFVPSRDGFAMFMRSGAEISVRGLSLDGTLGPIEVLVSDYQAEALDVFGHESGVLGFLRSEVDRFAFKYRGAADTPPTFASVSLPTPGRQAAAASATHVDGAGRVLIVWRGDQQTFASRYVPGQGFEATNAIGAAFATTPAISSDAQGNTLVVWAVLTAANNVEIWWNRLRVP